MSTVVVLSLNFSVALPVLVYYCLHRKFAAQQESSSAQMMSRCMSMSYVSIVSQALSLFALSDRARSVGLVFLDLSVRFGTAAAPGNAPKVS